MKKRLGPIETMMFAYIQLRNKTTVSTGELRKPLQLSTEQERKLLSRLAKAGMIARVRRGLYVVPPRLPLGGKWSPDEALALNTFMKDKGGRYQVCGPTAFNRYGFDQQIPVRIYAYNNRVSGERKIGAVVLMLIKVADKRLGSTDVIKTVEGQRIIYASRTRTLIDAVYDWSRFNSLPRAYQWIKQELFLRRVDPRELTRVAIQYGDIGTMRRIGVLMEQEGVEEILLRSLEKKLQKTTGPIPWIPNKPKRGKINRRWGVVVNE
ncbi:MAG: DUF6088 family protein [Candidatus Ratteibacteria bacterium]|jgi:predicted transcriptional regulator of viral defense system